MKRNPGPSDGASAQERLDHLLVTARAQLDTPAQRALDELIQKREALEQELKSAKEAENTAQARASLYELLAEDANDMISQHLADGTYLYVNNVCRSFLGFEPHELIGRNAFDFIHKEDVDRIRAIVASALRYRSGGVAQYRQYTKDGRIIWVETAARVPVNPAGGDSMRVVCTMRDITQRKAAEERLRQLSKAVEQNPASVMITNPAGEIVYANRKFYELTGYCPEEIIGQNPRILKSGLTPENDYRVLWESLCAGREWRGEFVNRKKNGELYWERAVICPIRDEVGHVTHYLGLKEDITARKQAEQALRESEERLQLVMTGSRDAFWDWDIQSGRVVRNRRWSEMLGYLPEELGSAFEQWETLIHPEDLLVARQYIAEHLAGRCQANEVEYRLKAKDGTFHWVLDRACVVKRDGQGRPVRMSGAFTDITRRKEAEAQIRLLNEQLEHRVAERTQELEELIAVLRGEIRERKLAEERLGNALMFNQEIIACAGEGIVVHDAQLRILEWNQSMEKLTGIARNFALGKDPFVLVPKLCQLGVDRDMMRALSGETLVSAPQYIVSPVTGEARWTMSTYTPHRDMRRKIIGVISTVHDITALKQTEAELKSHREHLEERVKEQTEELRKARDELERRVEERTADLLEANIRLLDEALGRQQAKKELEAQRVLRLRTDRLVSLGQMAGGIAHELNQPLVGVRGLAEHLLIARQRDWNLSEEEVEDSLRLIIEQADRMSHVIDHVRRFAREAGNGHAQPVQLNDVVLSCLELLQTQFLARGLDLQIELSEDLPSLMANPFSLEEVIFNLLNNARDTMQEKHGSASNGQLLTIRVRTDLEKRDDHPFVRLQVIDTGMGIPDEVLEHIFEPFFTTKEPDRGTGLGLSICDAIVKEWGGSLEVTSVPGEGTAFAVLFPANQNLAEL